MNGPILSASPSFPWRKNIASYLVPVCLIPDAMRFKDKVGNDPDAKKTFLILQDAFETLMDGRQRCQYDKANDIKGGKWPIQTCYDAFREEFRKERYGKWNEWYDENVKKWEEEDKEGGGTGPSDPPLTNATEAAANVTSAVAEVGGAFVNGLAWVCTQVSRHAWEFASFVGTAIGIGAYLWGAYM